MSDKNNAPSRHAAPKKRAKSPKPAKPARYKKSVRVAVSITSVFMALISVLMMTAGGYLWRTMSLIKTDDELQGEYPESLGPDEEDANLPDTSFDEADYNTSQVSQISAKGNTKDVTNLLLLGLDGRTSYKGCRSDTMMIVSINKKAKTIKLVSILRDTAVSIPGRDKNGDGKDDLAKLNASYAYGGFSLLSKTIEQNFRIKIDQYLGVNFVTFPIAVDAMGGIDIYMTKAEASKVCISSQKKEDWERGFKKIGTENKVYPLNGYQALQYARIRHIDSDFNRTNRQRKVVEQLIIKAKSMNFGTLSSILNRVLPEVITNMSGNQLIRYAMNAGTYSGYAVDTTFHLPEDKRYSNVRLPGGGAALQLKDPAQAVRNLHQWIYG